MERTDIVNNSTPLNRFTGIDDNPGAPIEPREPQYPLHCPYVPFLAEKGTTKKIYPNGGERLAIYGTSSFDKLSPYYNEYSYMSNILMANANIHATQRVKPEDAPPPANVTLYMDVLATKIPKYKRNSDGGYVTNELDEKVSDGVIDGWKIRYFAGTSPAGMKLGEQKINNNGSMVDNTDPDNPVRSKLVPIYDMAAAEFGKYYSNLGTRISPITGNNLKSRFLSEGKFLPYEISIIERSDTNTKGTAKKTLSGGAYSTVSFKKDSIHPYTEGILDVDLVFPHNWYTEELTAPAIKYYDFDNMYMYYDNLENLLKGFISTEKNYVSDEPEVWEDGVEAATIDWFDFTAEGDLAGEEHLLNWVSLKSSGKQINYFSVIKDEGVVAIPAGMTEVTIGSDSTLYLIGGGDGTLNIEEINKHVVNLMKEYLDPDAEVTVLSLNQETSFYDVGIPLDKKKELTNMLAVRPDTIVHFATHQYEYGETPMTTDEEYATALAILARAELIPESEIYGTSICRATVIMGSMQDINSVSKYRYTQNFELGNILAPYLGAANGKMNPLMCLDNGRANTILTLGKEYTPRYIPDSFKQVVWTAGVNYSEVYKTTQRAFLAVKTVHNNEQSILTDPILCYLNAKLCRVMDLAHKTFAGNTKDSNEVFANMLVKFMEKEMEGVIDNDRFTVTFRVSFTDPAVEGRLYAYRVFADVTGNVMKTAQVSTVATYAN